MDCCEQTWSTDKRSERSVRREQPRHGTAIYCKRDHAGGLFHMLSGRRAKVVLVTAESDDAVSADENIPPQVSAWYSTNSVHSRVRSLPLGLGNSYCATTVKAEDLADAVTAHKPDLLYANFRVETNLNEREAAWSFCRTAEQRGWAKCQPGSVTGSEYLRELSRHKFAACPWGNGTDTHRLWEALYVGTIPIVRRHPALEFLHDLPVLFIDDWGSLTRSYLEQQSNEMRQRSWNTGKLFLPWWRERILEEKAQIRSNVGVSTFLVAWVQRTVRARSKSPSENAGSSRGKGGAA